MCVCKTAKSICLCALHALVCVHAFVCLKGEGKGMRAVRVEAGLDVTKMSSSVSFSFLGFLNSWSRSRK